MMDKGGFSFVAMLVINPIVILFYQNCSLTPISHAKSENVPTTYSRQIASESKHIPAATASAKSLNCNEYDKDSDKKECAKAE